MKPLRLTRNIKLEKYELLMEIGIRDARSELNAILMLIKEQGGSISAKDVCDKLLKGRPIQVGKAILDRCRYLDLIDRRGRLTNTGHESLQTGEVFIPERGRYTVWYTDDPLLPTKFLNLEAVYESPLNDEIKDFNKKYNNGSDLAVTEIIPEKIQSLQGNLFSLFSQERGKVHIRKIDLKGLSVPLNSKDKLRAILTITPNTPPRVSFDGKFKIKETLPILNYEDSWKSVLGIHANQWENTNNDPALKVSYEGLSEKELFTFEKTLQLSKPAIPEYGIFDDTKIEKVPIKPQSATDAEYWANYLIRKSIDTYVDQTGYEKIVNSASSKFIDYPNIRTLTLEQLLEETRKQREPDGRLPREYWYLHAPIDLHPGRF